MSALRATLRQLAKSPGFTAVNILRLVPERSAWLSGVGLLARLPVCPYPNRPRRRVMPEMCPPGLWPLGVTFLVPIFDAARR